ncbi:MAG: rod-binding protein [Hyphomicrobiaceae bacterium]|nr:rod-binding protein [Hyphomicrobiaceae bacterium]
MLPRGSGSVFGEGTAGMLWKSMLAEQIAMELARGGGIGIARMIRPSIAAGGAQPGTG